LYDVNGAKVNLLSSFSFQYDSNADGTDDEWGYVSQWGVSYGGSVSPDGQTVTTPAGFDVTLSIIPGKLQSVSTNYAYTTILGTDLADGSNLYCLSGCLKTGVTQQQADDCTSGLGCSNVYVDPSYPEYNNAITYTWDAVNSRVQLNGVNVDYAVNSYAWYQMTLVDGTVLAALQQDYINYGYAYYYGTYTYYAFQSSSWISTCTMTYSGGSQDGLPFYLEDPLYFGAYHHTPANDRNGYVCTTDCDTTCDFYGYNFYCYFPWAVTGYPSATLKDGLAFIDSLGDTYYIKASYLVEVYAGMAASTCTGAGLTVSGLVVTLPVDDGIQVSNVNDPAPVPPCSTPFVVAGVTTYADYTVVLEKIAECEAAAA